MNDSSRLPIGLFDSGMQRIREKTPGTSQQLATDFDLQDILILNLQRAVQISTDIATTILAESSSVPSTMTP
jgi:hypothetical protein